MASHINCVAVSPTGAYMAFGDSDGRIHLMTAADESEPLAFNGFDGQPIEWADAPQPLENVLWTKDT